MAGLSDHIENALNEGRMLLLGGQVLLGFSYDICYESGFQKAPRMAQFAEMVAIGLLTLALGWVIWPAAFHRIAERGRFSEALHRFVTRVLDWALLPMAASLGFALYAGCLAMHLPGAWLIGTAGAAFTLALWYFGAIRQGRRRAHSQQPPEGKSELAERIKKVLIECRMALPGAQAFLGFQFAVIFEEAFAQLPRSSQVIHFATLLCTTCAIVLLIAPAAYHRLAEAGEDSEHFHTVASRFLVAALVFLAPGMCGDLFVTLRKVTGSEALALGIAGGFLVAFYSLWFAVSLWRRGEPGRNRLKKVA